MQTERLIQSKN